MKFRFTAFFSDGSVQQMDLDGTDRCDHPDFINVVRDYESKGRLLTLVVTYQPNPRAPFQVIRESH